MLWPFVKNLYDCHLKQHTLIIYSTFLLRCLKSGQLADILVSLTASNSSKVADFSRAADSSWTADSSSVLPKHGLEYVLGWPHIYSLIILILKVCTFIAIITSSIKTRRDPVHSCLDFSKVL